MNATKGIALKLLATLSATAMLACVRGLEGAIPTGEVVFFRSIFALLPLLIVYGARGQLAGIVRTRSVSGHFGRGLSGTGGMFFSYMALAYLPLVQQTAFSYAAPIFTVIFAALFLGETVRIYRWSAVVIGLGGVLIMLLPATTRPDAGHALVLGGTAALIAAACSALSTIQIRKMTQTENPAAIVFWFAVLTSAIGLATSLFGWSVPDPRQLALLIGCGLFGGLAQVLVTLSLRAAHASLLAPFDYVSMIWSVILGYALFASVPDVYTVLGALVVIAAGMFTIWREAQLKANAARAA